MVGVMTLAHVLDGVQARPCHHNQAADPLILLFGLLNTSCLLLHCLKHALDFGESFFRCHCLSLRLILLLKILFPNARFRPNWQELFQRFSDNECLEISAVATQISRNCPPLNSENNLKFNCTLSPISAIFSSRRRTCLCRRIPSCAR